MRARFKIKKEGGGEGREGGGERDKMIDIQMLKWIMI